MSRHRHKRGKSQTGNGCTVVSGAYATELQARGLKPGENAEVWNLLRPDDVRDVARSYVEAGARVIVTNTFQANPPALARACPSLHVADVNYAGVALARDAAGGRAEIFGCMGPAAAETSEAQCRAYLQQATTLVEAGADALVLETFTSLTDAAIATGLAAAVGQAVIACVTIADERQAPAIAAVLERAGAAALGLNCLTPGEMLPVCRALREATDLPLWMKPSAGLPRRAGDRFVYDMTPDEFADGAMALVEAGANFIGGCCGAGPDHIRAVAERLEGR